MYMKKVLKILKFQARRLDEDSEFEKLHTLTRIYKLYYNSNLVI